MPFNHTISAILRGQWMIEKQWAYHHLPIVFNMLQHPTQDVNPNSSNSVQFPYAIDPATMQNQPLYINVNGRVVPNTALAPNSVGILPINGPCTKYDGDCGEPGMIQRTNWLIDMQQRSNIGSIVQVMDTPGGEVRALTGYMAALQKSNKPVLAFCDGMVASLGVWFSSGSSEFYASNELDQIGSVGTVWRFIDFSEQLAKDGIKIIDVYAPQSTDKGGKYDAVLNGDTSEVEAELQMLTDKFIQHVNNGRGEVAKANESAWNTGKMFYANDAKKIGLIDGIKPLEQVVSKAAWLGKRNKN